MITIAEAIKTRHAVRKYTDRKIPSEIAEELQNDMIKYNSESGLNMQIILNDPKTFTGLKSRSFKNVSNYIALVGKKKEDNEKLGYYGELLVLKAQSLGLNTCWVAISFSKSNCLAKINDGEKLVCAISLGYGETQGIAHVSKPKEKVCKINSDTPKWFDSGIEAALLAPTAINQQKFMFTLNGNKVKAETTGGFYSDVDIGIVKCHFEIGAGKENFEWD